MTKPDLLDQLSRANRENERLREALKPFAFIAGLDHRMADGESTLVNITHCRAAAQALAASPREGEGMNSDEPSLREPVNIVDFDALRTEWHERAVIANARALGNDPKQALAQSRAFRAFLKGDVRLSIRDAMDWATTGNGRFKQGRNDGSSPKTQPREGEDG